DLGGHAGRLNCRAPPPPTLPPREGRGSASEGRGRGSAAIQTSGVAAQTGGGALGDRRRVRRVNWAHHKIMWWELGFEIREIRGCESLAGVASPPQTRNQTRRQVRLDGDSRKGPDSSQTRRA